MIRLLPRARSGLDLDSFLLTCHNRRSSCTLLIGRVMRNSSFQGCPIIVIIPIRSIPRPPRGYVLQNAVHAQILPEPITRHHYYHQQMALPFSAQVELQAHLHLRRHPVLGPQPHQPY